MFDALKGSCALPLLYRKRVLVGGHHVVDGGVSDPIPAETAFHRGARRIVVVRSRPASFFKVDSLADSIIAMALFREPGVMRAVRKTAAAYKRAVDFMARPPEGCEVIQIAPETALATRRMTQDVALLEKDYALGHELGRAAIARW